MSDPKKQKAEQGKPSRGLSTLQKALLGVSALITVAGLVMILVGAMSSDPPPPEGSDASSLLRQGLVATGAEAPEPVREGLEPWGPSIFRLGFSFFIGFAIGYAARSFLKILILVIGVVALGLFALHYFGVIEGVNWGGVEDAYDDSMPWIKEQTQSFVAFIQGYLPSAASAGAGLFLGFRRR
jgi:uncharacterized membrane protein (Fun14 family)